MNAKSNARAAQSLDRRIVPTFVLFGAAALIWLAGIGTAKAEAEAGFNARAAAEKANPGSATLSQLLILHRQAAASNSAVQIPHAAGPCCTRAAEAK